MADAQTKCPGLSSVTVIMVVLLVIASQFVFTDGSMNLEISRSMKLEISSFNATTKEVQPNYVMKASALKQPDKSGYKHVWPKMRIGWKIIVGTIIGFFGAASGSVGGVGGGGIFVPMLTLIIGFDPKTSTAISKCMVMGGAAATVYYNVKQRHPTLNLPIIDYNLALLFQPMLVLGVSIGVAFNVIFADWMVTALLIVLFIGLSTKAFFKGLETWKKETQLKKEAAETLKPNGTGGEEVEPKPVLNSQSNDVQVEIKEPKKPVSILENVYWRELGLIVAVWVVILALQIAKSHTATCSVAYWLLNVSQIPVVFGISSYEAVNLYKGRRVIASKGEGRTNLKVHKLVLYCVCGIVAGLVGGLLGLGGGFIMGPLFLEMGIPPQVASATSTFVMLFSSSISVVEYYLLKRFPVPYALYFFGVATVAAIVGQYIIGKLIKLLGRASLIIFVLALTIFVSALSLGGVGISKMIERLERKQYMGFENICTYKA